MHKLIGKGNTAEVFEWGNEKVCKLFYNNYPYDAVLNEFHNAKLFMQNNLPVPKAYEVLTYNNRTGIVYERIWGKSLLECLMEGKYNIDTALDILTTLHKKILSVSSCRGFTYKNFLSEIVLHSPLTTNKTLLHKIAKLPIPKSICHGDFHPGNVLIKSDNSYVIIDLMNVCDGVPEYDVARTYFLLKEYCHSQFADDTLKQIPDIYLHKMRYEYNRIFQFVEVIQECRKFE